MIRNKVFLGFIIATALPFGVNAACSLDPGNYDGYSVTEDCIKLIPGCDGKCTSYYNLETHDVVVKPNPGATGDIVLTEWDTRSKYGTSWDAINVRNMTIDEGITGLGSTSVWNFGTGTLKLPSTLASMGGIAIYNVGFETVDVSDVKNLQDSSGAMGHHVVNMIAIDGAYNLQNLIVSEDTSPISLGYAYNEFYFPPGEVVVQCKGKDTSKCEELVNWCKTCHYIPEEFEISSAFYEEYDQNGNPIEMWDANGGMKYSYDKSGTLQRQTDGYGNVLWARRIYTVDEAERVAGKVNTFRVRYR